jgi:hypothetical protein
MTLRQSDDHSIGECSPLGQFSDGLKTFSPPHPLHDQQAQPGRDGQRLQISMLAARMASRRARSAAAFAPKAASCSGVGFHGSPRQQEKSTSPPGTRNAAASDERHCLPPLRSRHVPQCAPQHIRSSRFMRERLLQSQNDALRIHRMSLSYRTCPTSRRNLTRL